jgi:hypothetical protein
MGRVSGGAVLGLAEVWEDTAADCRNAAKLLTASRRPSGALEESAEVIMLCSGPEEVIGIREAGRAITACHQTEGQLWLIKDSTSPLVCGSVEARKENSLFSDGIVPQALLHIARSSVDEIRNRRSNLNQTALPPASLSSIG